MKDQFMKTYGLPAIVFLTGGCVLIVEVLATRILSPFFGNTIFTVSSVISTVLAALSLGYFLGGRLADRRPEPSLFYFLILCGGISVLAIYILKIGLINRIGYSLPLMTGPLLCSIILFFIPSAILGAASPFAIKIQTLLTPERGAGRISGEIFFWSTLGSIAGSLLAGFILIPLFGVQKIILVAGGLLTALGLALFLRGGGYKKKLFRYALTALVVCAAFLTDALLAPPDRVTYSRDGVYEKILIYYNLKGDPPTLYLSQDRTVSGMVYLGSNELAAPYTRYYPVYSLFKPELKNALVIGGGAYSVPKDLLEKTGASIDVTEIEPSMFDLAKRYFGLDEDPRLNNILQDGRRFLRDTDKKYDFIFSDAYNTLFSVPPHLTTAEFFKTAKEKLAPDGVFVANLIGHIAHDGKPSFILSEMKTFRTVFSNSYLFAVHSPSDEEPQNFIMVGCNCDKKLDFNAPDVRNSENPVIRDLSAHVVNLDALDLSSPALLTDDYAPVEYLMASTVVRMNTSQKAEEEAQKNP